MPYRVAVQAFPNKEIRANLSLIPGPPLGSVSPSGRSHSEPEDGGPIEFGPCEPEGSSPSPLTLDVNSSKAAPSPKKKREKTGRFTREARAKIQRAGGALDLFDPEPGHTLFLTGTLPGGTDAAIQAIANEASWVVVRVKQWIWSRYREFSYSFYCWELQRRGALHLHYCFYCPSAEISAGFCRDFKPFWIGLMHRLSLRAGTDAFARLQGGTHKYSPGVVQAYCQPCRKSVAAYMAKYVGKSDGKRPSFPFPSRWSGVSRPLGQLLDSLTVSKEKEFPDYSSARRFFQVVSEEAGDNAFREFRWPHRYGPGSGYVVYFGGALDVFEFARERVLSLFSKGISSMASFVSHSVSELLSQFSDASAAFLRDSEALIFQVGKPQEREAYNLLLSLCEIASPSTSLSSVFGPSTQNRRAVLERFLNLGGYHALARFFYGVHSEVYRVIVKICCTSDWGVGDGILEPGCEFLLKKYGLEDEENYTGTFTNRSFQAELTF